MKLIKHIRTTPEVDGTVILEMTSTEFFAIYNSVATIYEEFEVIDQDILNTSEQIIEEVYNQISDISTSMYGGEK